MLIVCLDLEGVLVPEIWIEFSRRAGIPELSKTTRDEPDYDKLMRGRIEILDRRKFRLPDIQAVIEDMICPAQGSSSNGCASVSRSSFFPTLSTSLPRL